MRTQSELEEAFDVLRWAAENSPEPNDKATMKFLEGMGAAINWFRGDNDGHMAEILEAVREGRKKCLTAAK